MYLANDGGVWNSSNSGATWTPLNTGLQTTELFDTAVSGTIAVATAFHWGWLTTEDVSTGRWSNQLGGWAEFIESVGDPVHAGVFYALNWPALQRLTFTGDGTSQHLERYGPAHPWCVAVDEHSQSDALLVGTSDGHIFRTLDGQPDAPTWTEEEFEVSVPQPVDEIRFIAYVPGPIGSSVFNHFRLPEPPGSAYAISYTGRLFYKDNVNGEAPSPRDWQVESSDQSRQHRPNTQPERQGPRRPRASP